jgi:hypothetical protein
MRREDKGTNKRFQIGEEEIGAAKFKYLDRSPAATTTTTTTSSQSETI